MLFILIIYMIYRIMVVKEISDTLLVEVSRFREITISNRTLNRAGILGCLALYFALSSLVLFFYYLMLNAIHINNLNSYYKKRFKIKSIKNKNFLSWVSSNDVARAFYFIIKNKKLSGVFNIVSPKMTHNQELLDYLKNTHGKAFFNLPNIFISKIMKNYIYLLSNLKVQPKRLLDTKFEFEDKILTTYLQKTL